MAQKSSAKSLMKRYTRQADCHWNGYEQTLGKKPGTEGLCEAKAK